MKIHAMTPFAERDRLQEKKLWGVSPGKEDQKPIFEKGQPRLPHNLGFLGIIFPGWTGTWHRPSGQVLHALEPTGGFSFYPINRPGSLLLSGSFDKLPY